MEKSIVSGVRCHSYEAREIDAKVKEVVVLLGGWGNILKGAQKVLLKPNLLSDRLPEEGVTTHPFFVRAVIRSLKTYGVRDISLGDAPNGLCNDLSKVFEKTGMAAIAREEGVRLATFQKGRTVKDILIAEEVLGADAIINLPKAKTHTLTIITGAVKNMFGVVPGFTKVQYHLLYPHGDDFVNMLLKIYGTCKPYVSLMDGIVSMQGDGPANGSLVRTGWILASTDAVSLDAVFAQSIGIDPERIPLLINAQKQGLGIAKKEYIELKGLSCLADIKKEDFLAPKTAFLVYYPRFLLNILARWIQCYPVVMHAACKKCGQCVRICPRKTIHVTHKKIIIETSQCIRCFCCQEICPYGAIGIKRSFLANLMFYKWNK